MKRLVLGMAVLFFLACGGRKEVAVAEIELCDTDFVTTHCMRVRYTATEQRLLTFGLVDVQALDPTIRVHLVYATEDNFLGRVMYADIHRALLHPTMAAKVAAAQQALHQERPDLDLLILDAARPLSVQYQMFHVVAGTPRNRYELRVVAFQPHVRLACQTGTESCRAMTALCRAKGCGQPAIGDSRTALRNVHRLA